MEEQDLVTGKIRQGCRVEAKYSPTAIETPGAVETNGSTLTRIKDETVRRTLLRE